VVRTNEVSVRRLLILVVCAFGLSLIPFESLNSPAWDVWIVDQLGQPVSGMTVRLSYQNYSAEGEAHEVNTTADQNGYARFPPQTLRASLMRRRIFTLLSARAGAHASLGPHAHVFALGKGLEGVDVDPKTSVLVDWTGEPRSVESHIVVKPQGS